ncbi:MAG: hypothetical protein E7329_08850 [Clostridiales bacterium]|nr:hypothetical protein [Clostridiales bacterium]
MANGTKPKQLNAEKTVLYSSGQTPPAAPLFFSSLQHMLLILSLGMAMPVSIARAAGLDLNLSGSLLAAALFTMGLTGILQTLPNRFIGSGFQSLSVADSAALSACILAAEIGGVPLVLGMTVFSGLLRFLLGSFTFKLRKFFPAEVTGTMIFILGVNLVPTALKNFLGNAAGGVYNPMHLVVAVLTLLFMLACSLFLKPLKPYTALLGIVFGFVISAVTGVFDPASLAQLQDQAIVALPIYADLSYSFDLRALIPFIVVTVAGVVDNIGDFSASQSADDPHFKKPNWKSIESGIRGNALGTAVSGMLGGPIQSTATTNIGIAGASGITSRKVAYLACGMLMAASFFPGLTNVLSLIPTPVLGAVLLYSGCYIMAGGFSALTSCVMDDRRIFTVFLSIFFAISTLIPNLYSFLPQSVSTILVSPMVMGVCVLLLTTLLSRIGIKKVFSFVSGVSPMDVIALNDEIENTCKERGTERALMRKMQISFDSLCEGVYEITATAHLQFEIKYDNQQIKIHVESKEALFPENAQDPQEECSSTLGVSLMMLKNMFDDVRLRVSKGHLIIDVCDDL